MCLTMDFFPDGPGVNVTNTGYDLREFKLTCPVIWRGQFTCLPIGGSPGTNVGRAREFLILLFVKEYHVAPIKCTMSNLQVLQTTMWSA